MIADILPDGMSLARRNGASVIEPDREVEIDRSSTVERYRYVCPNGHIDWDRTNNHIWCRGCRRRNESGDTHIDAEHHAVLDKQEYVLIPWDQVVLE